MIFRLFQRTPQGEANRGSVRADRHQAHKAVCIGCGAIKSNAFIACVKCGFRPLSETQLAISLAFSDHHIPQTTIEDLGKKISLGMKATVSDADLQGLLAAVRKNNLHDMLGIDSNIAQKLCKIENDAEILSRVTIYSFDEILNDLRLNIDEQFIDAHSILLLCLSVADINYGSLLSKKEYMDYFAKRFPWVFCFEAVRRGICDTLGRAPDEFISFITLNYPIVSNMFISIIQTLDAEKIDEGLAGIAFQNRAQGLQQYLQNPSGIFSLVYWSIKEALDEVSQ